MSFPRFFAPFAPFAAACAVFVSGCASIDDRPMQQIEVHTVLDHREVAGVGCVLGNGAGRWFVVAPGRVTVQRSRDPLTVDCARAGTGSAVEQAAASSPSMVDGDKLIGDLVIKAGLDAYVRPFDGAAVSYPPTLTVLMRPATAAVVAAAAERQAADSVNPLF